jgi:hypothetical protein
VPPAVADLGGLVVTGGPQDANDDERYPGLASLPLSFRPKVAERLLLASWPDNLRGLNRLVHRLLVGGSTTEIGMGTLRDALPELFRDSESPDATAPAPDRKQSERPERTEFVAVYEKSGKSVRATAQHFGRDRRQIYRWLELFGIEVSEFLAQLDEGRCRCQRPGLLAGSTGSHNLALGQPGIVAARRRSRLGRPSLGAPASGGAPASSEGTQGERL